MSQNNQAPPARGEQKNIDYLGLFKRAARIVWQNRFLFWFGLLMALGSPGGMNFSPSGNDLGSNQEAAKNFFASHWVLAATLATLAFAVVIIFFLLSLLGKAGLIGAVNKIVLGKKMNFRSGWKIGKRYFLKLLRLFLLFFLAILIIILVLAIPVVYLLTIHSWIAALLVGLLAVAILIPIALILFFTNTYATFYIVLSDLKVMSAVETAYGLLTRRLGPSLIFGLLLLALNIIFALAVLPIAALVLLILIPAGTLFFFLSKIAFGIYLALAILLFIAAALFVGSIFTTYKTTVWVLFFREIAEVKKEEFEKVAEEETEKQIAAAPEKA